LLTNVTKCDKKSFETKFLMIIDVNPIQCLSQYCEMSINEGKISLLSCPDGSCPLYQTKNNLLSPREIKLLVSQELYETYKRFRLNWIIENDPNRTWCPSPNCETICYIKTNQKHGNKPLPVYCSTVSLKYIDKNSINVIFLYFILIVQSNFLFFVSKELAFGYRLQKV
jgi:hypothetical protein